MGKSIALIFLLAFFFPSPAGAEDAEVPPTGYFSAGKDQNREADPEAAPKKDVDTGYAAVTPLSSCYNALGAAEAAEIRANFEKPWQECTRRLALKKKKEQTVEPGENPEKPEEAPQNYYRIAKEPEKDKGEENGVQEKAPQKNPTFIQKLFRLE